MTEKQHYEKGKLYQYNGSEFVELEPSTDIKVPVSEKAIDALKTVRKAAQRLIGMRPELSLTASAMLLTAAELPGIAAAVRDYGLRVYSGTDTSAVKQTTASDSESDIQPVATVVPEVLATPATEMPTAAEAAPESSPLLRTCN